MSSTAELVREDRPHDPDEHRQQDRVERGHSLRRPLLAVVACAAALAVVALLVSALWWRADGGRWFMVETPSMGTAMPVGTLVLTKPVAIDDVEVGDVITFHAPQSGTVYTHRVISVGPEGLTTQGDVNATPDPGVLVQDNLIGEVVEHAPALGWALKAVPLLLIGGAVTWVVSLLLGARHRRSIRLVGASATVAVANFLLHPWVGLEKMSQRTPDDGQGVLIDVISTGLVPVKAQQLGGGASAVLHDGEVATLHLDPRANGAYDVFSTLHLSWWGWVVLVAACLTPMALALLLGPARVEEAPVLRPETDDRDQLELVSSPQAAGQPVLEVGPHLPTQATDDRPRVVPVGRSGGRRFRADALAETYSGQVGEDHR